MDPIALLKKLDGGDVSNIIPEVKAALKGPRCGALAHRILVRIANLTLMKTKGGSEPILSNNEEIVQLTLYCSQAIESDTAWDLKMNSNPRTIVAISNILSQFRRTKDTHSTVKLLTAFLPILQKMSSSFSEADEKIISQYLVNMFNMLISVDDSVFKLELKNELSPFYFWDLMLRVSSLVKNSDLRYILNGMRSLSSKFEKLHLNKDEETCAFNSALVGNLLKYSKTDSWEVVGQESEVNKVFDVLVSALQQLLKTRNLQIAHNIISPMMEFVASSFAKFSYHVECFKIISRLRKLFQLPHGTPPQEEVFINEVDALSAFLEKEKKRMHPAFTWVVYVGGCAFLSSMEEFTRVPGFAELLSTAVLTSIHHFGQSVSKLLLLSCHSVCTADDGKPCPFKGDTSLAFQCVRKFVLLCNDLKKDKEEWSEVLPIVKDSCDNLELVLSKASEENCVKKQLLKTMLYDLYSTLGYRCYSASAWKYGRIFFERQTRDLCAAGGEISSTDMQKIFYILPRLLVCYQNLELKKEAKLASLLALIVHFKFDSPKANEANVKFLTEKWVLLQNEDTSPTTADKVLSDRALLKTVCPQFSFSEHLIPKILLWELSCYAVNRLKSTDAILNAWVSLKESKATALQLLEGSALTCQALFSSNDLVSWYDLLAASISDWLKQVGPHEAAVALCSMGAHYHIKFLIMAQKHFDENYNKVEVVKVYCTNPASVRKPEDVRNPADVCQVQSTFPNLNLEREQKLMDILEAAINYWNSSLENGLSAKDYTSSPIVAASGDYILHVAFLFSLWGYNSAAAKAFQICCTFARKMSLDDLLLQALSGLMSTIEVSKECISEAENLLDGLKNHSKFNYFQKVFSTSRAFQALRAGDFLEGAKALEDIIKQPPTPSTQWCYAYAKTLQASYLLLPTSKQVDCNQRGSDLVRDGLGTILKNIQNRRLSHSPLTFAAVVHQTLCSSLWIGRYYLHRHMTREARCYLQTELVLALRLGLATRAAEFICELALIDLLTENVDEAVTKTQDLKCILDKRHISSENDNDEDEVLSSSSFLVPKHTDTNLGCSPSLEKNEVFRIPIIGHDLSCKCYMCKNASVQIIWLMYGHIQAKINALRFFVHDSHATYLQIFKLAEASIKRLCANARSQGALLQQHQLTYSLICSKLDFVDMLVMYEKDKEARTENAIIFSLLKNLQTDENNLSWETQEQKICIAEMSEEVQGKLNARRTPEPKSGQLISPNIPIDKTPERIEPAATPTLPGRRRPPLKLVEPSKLHKGSNQLIVPLSHQQFYSPKVSRDLESIIKSDDDDDDDDGISAPSKENVSRIPRRGLKPSCSKLEFVDESGATTNVSDSHETVSEIKNVTTNKVSKSVRSSKPKTANSICNNTHEKPSSSRRPTSKALLDDGKAASKPVPLNEKPSVSRRVTSKPAEKSVPSLKATSTIRPVAPTDAKPLTSQKEATSNSKELSLKTVATANVKEPTSKEATAPVKAITKIGARPSTKSNLKCVRSSVSSETMDGNANDSEQVKSSRSRTLKQIPDVSEGSVIGNGRQTRQRNRL